MILTPEVIEQCRRPLWYLAWRYRNHGADVEDLVASAWLRIVEDAPDFDEERGTFMSFVLARGRCAMIDYIRRQSMGARSVNGQRRVELMTEQYPAPEAFARFEAWADVQNIKKRALFTDSERRALSLRYEQDMELTEIGARLGFCPSRASQVLKSARGKMAIAARV